MPSSAARSSSHNAAGLAPTTERPVPFDGLYRRRNDAESESINRALDDTLWLRRAHSIGHQRQHLNLLTFALGVNSLALHRHLRTSHLPVVHGA